MPAAILLASHLAFLKMYSIANMGIYFELAKEKEDYLRKKIFSLVLDLYREYIFKWNDKGKIKVHI